MSITRMLFPIGLAGLAACSSPTGPDENVTSLPASDKPQVGHFHPIGTTCVPGAMSSQRCAPTSGAN